MTLKLNWYKTGQANGALSLSPSDFCMVGVRLPYFHFCVMLRYLLLLELGVYPQPVLLINSLFPGHFKAPFRLMDKRSNIPPKAPTVINWDLRIY